MLLILYYLGHINYFVIVVAFQACKVQIIILKFVKVFFHLSFNPLVLYGLLFREYL
jgi:hypothetical protein